MAVTNINTKQIKDATILNVDVDAAAAIAGTKISPNFGSQDVVTTGNAAAGTATPLTDSRATGSVTTTASMFLGVLAGDPSTPVAGQIWYNSTDQQFKGRNATSIVILG